MTWNLKRQPTAFAVSLVSPAFAVPQKLISTLTKSDTNSHTVTNLTSKIVIRCQNCDDSGDGNPNPIAPPPKPLAQPTPASAPTPTNVPVRPNTLNNAPTLDQVMTLRNVNISFHTNNEDKDSDTHVTVTVKDRDNRVVARLSNDLGHFDDNSDTGPYALKILNASDKKSLQQGSVTIRIDPNGHDTWRFGYTLDLLFGDGSHLSAASDGLELSQNRRQQTFGLDGVFRNQ